MAWIDTLKDLWWLAGIICVLIASVWRLAIKTNKAMEAIKNVKSNAERIDDLQEKMTSLEEKTDEIHAGIIAQKKDISALTVALLAIMDELRANETTGGLSEASKTLRKHLVENR